ncbi:MAG: hypothetical protein ABIO04_04050 [Ferruginibacter sp.]
MHQSKSLIFLLLIIILPVSILAQSISNHPDITGLWKGTIYNDTTQLKYSYEIGISEEKGKLTGFSHTWFILDDKQYYGVKKVKVKFAPDGKIIIEDAGLIANNYPVSPAKGVRQLNILTLQIADSAMSLVGPFSTNRTKLYSPLTGTISLQRKNDYWQSALVPHLQELGLVSELSFVKADIRATEIASKNSTPVPGIKTEVVKEDESIVRDMPETINEKKQATHGKATTVKRPAITSVSTPDIKKEIVVRVEPSSPAADVLVRTTVLQQTVTFASDSLQLSLYDNGEIDGDTVSVLMNGKILIAKAGLGTNAVRKTIYVPQNSESIELVMYAENLGTIAPNTGLLVLHDGKSIYEIRFSGDLKKNASIILKRKKIN